MFLMLAPVFALLLSNMFLMAGNAMQGMILPLRADLENFSSLTIGAIGSSYYIGFLLGCIFAPVLVRRAGHIRSFTAMVAVASATTLLHAMIVEPALWLVFRVFTGFCLAGLALIVESWINEKATSETRGTIMSVYAALNLIMVTAGQMLITVFAPEHFNAFAFASILVSLAAVPLALTKSSQPIPPALVSLRPKYLIKRTPTGLMASGVIGLVNGGFWALAPLYGATLNMTNAQIAAFMSIMVIGGALSQWPVGRISDKMDRRVVLAWIYIYATFIALLIGLWSNLSLFMIFGLIFIYGMCSLPAYSLAASHAFDRAEEGMYVEMSAALLICYSLGAIISPLIFAPIMDSFGPRSLFVCFALCQLGLVFYLVQRIGVRKRIKFADKDVFDTTITGTVSGPMTPTPLPEEPDWDTSLSEAQAEDVVKH